MSEIEWKIEDGELWVNSPVDGRDFWSHPNGFFAATILRAAVEAERRSILMLVDEHSSWARSFSGEDMCDRIATAIRARGEG